MGKLSIRDWALLAFIVLINIIGFGIGIVYYGSQLAGTDPIFLIFVPDCPLYVGLFAVLILQKHFGMKEDLFALLVSVGLIKYAAWTLFVLAFYGWYFFGPSLPGIAMQSAILFTLHIGMTAEGFILPLKKVAKWQAGVVLAWFLLNDFADYAWPGVHPFLPPGADVMPAMVFAVASTFAITWLAVKLVKENKRIVIAGLSG